MFVAPRMFRLIDDDRSFLDEVHRTAQPDYVPTTGQIYNVALGLLFYPLISGILQMIF